MSDANLGLLCNVCGKIFKSRDALDFHIMYTKLPGHDVLQQVIVCLFSRRTGRANLKVSRSRNKIVEPQLLPKNERTNLFFYPDDSEILET